MDISSWYLLVIEIKWDEWLVRTLAAKGLNWLCDKVVKKLKKNPVKKAYEEAYKNWDAGIYVKKEHKDYSLSTFEEFTEYVLSRRDIHEDDTFELFQLFEAELAKSPETSGVLENLRGITIEEGVEEILNEVKRLGEMIGSQSQLLSEVNDKLSQHNKGCREFEIPEGYMQRYCSQKVSSRDYIKYLLEYGDVKSYKLLDIVLGKTECKGNKFILYGDAHFGKTYELKKLAYDLKLGGEYIPVMYEVNDYRNLNENLPALDNEHDMGMVLIIDALDEKFDGEERIRLYKEIKGYAKAHPYLHIVLSCRSNFIGETEFAGFKPFVLNSLSPKDADQYLKNRGLEMLTSMIEQHKMIEFYRIPFYLKTLADYYEDNKALPRNKTALYDYFINKKLDEEEKKELKNYASMKRKGVRTLQLIAVALQLMGENKLSQDDIYDLVDDDEESIDRALRTSLLQVSEGKYYGFSHNSFKEYFVAKYLLSLHDLDKIQNLSCYNHTKEVRNEWFNTVALLLSMLPKNDELSADIMEWITQENKDMVLFIDEQMFEEKQKTAIFKEIIEGCKIKDLRFGDFVTTYYEELMNFGYSDESVKYLMKELKACKEMNNHLVNILFCLKYLQWSKLGPIKSKQLRKSLLRIFEEFIINPESAYVLFEGLSNPDLMKQDMVDDIWAIIKNEEHPNIARHFVSYVLEADLVEPNIDRIIHFSPHIHDYGDGHCSHAVSRDSLMYSYQRVEKWENIQKVLKQMVVDVKGHYYLSGMENREYQKAMSCLLKKVVMLAKNHPDATDFVFNILLDIAEERKSIRWEEKDVFVEFFEETESVDYYFEISLGKLKGLLINDNKEMDGKDRYELADGYAYYLALFLNEERLEDVCAVYPPNSSEGYYLLSFIMQFTSETISKEIVIIQKNRFPGYYRDYNKPSKWDLRHQRDYDELMDYEKFKERVLKVLDEKIPQSKSDVIALRKIKMDLGDEEIEEISQYVFTVFSWYTDNDDKLDVEGVRKFVANEANCRKLMVETTMDILHNTSCRVVVSEAQRKLFTSATMEWLDELSTHPYYNHFRNPAISALLYKEVVVDRTMLLQLLPYSNCYIYLRDEGFSGKNYTLFDLIREEYRDSVSTLNNVLIECIDKGFGLNEHNQKIWGVYLIKQSVTSEYQRMIEWAQTMTDSDPAYSIIQAMIENPATRLLVARKAVISEFDIMKRIFIYECLASDVKFDDFVRRGVEKEFGKLRKDRKYQALRLLLAKGSLMGLRYMTKHPERVDFSTVMHYRTLDALPLLMKIYSVVIEKSYRSDYHCVMNAIEEIAMASEENWKAVRAEFEKKIKWRRKKYIHLNWYIENWDNKIKAKNTPAMGLEEVKRLLNMQ